MSQQFDPETAAGITFSDTSFSTAPDLFSTLISKKHCKMLNLDGTGKNV
jgi:hypothetical protein